MALKLTELKVLRAFESSSSNPYASVNDYACSQYGAVFWIMGNDGRKWYARARTGNIVFSEYTA